MKNADTMAVRCTTASMSVADRSGWMMYAALVQRQTLTGVHTVTGVFTTVYIEKMSPSHVTRGLTETVCLANHGLMLSG